MKKILIVDDEENVLSGIRRLLRKQYDITLAQSGADGIHLFKRNGPFAVVISDMLMPGMDGASMLSRIREIDPDSVRIMLTGDAAQSTAVEAVNHGHIFRFLNKPCSPVELKTIVASAVRQYELITAERELLEKTVKGSIRMLTDILQIANPMVFSRGERLRKYAASLGRLIAYQDGWKLEVASMLSQIGWITVPSATLRKFYLGSQLSEQEKEMITDNRMIVRDLVRNIPRLDFIADMITARNNTPDLEQLEKNDPVAVGGAVLRVVEYYDILRGRGVMPDEMESFFAKFCSFDKSLLGKFLRHNQGDTHRINCSIFIDQLKNGMILSEDIMSYDGISLALKGFRINDTIRLRLRNFKLQGDIDEKVKVLLTEKEAARFRTK